MIKNRRLLIPVLFAVVLTVGAEVPGKDGVAVNGISQLFPAADVKLEPNDGGAVRMEGDVAVVDVAPERSFSGAKFVFGKPFAFIDCRTVSVEISNRTDRAMGFGFYGIHRGDYTWHAAQRFRLEPNQSKVITALNRPKSYVLSPGSQAIPGLIGYDAKSFPNSVNKSSTIDDISFKLFSTDDYFNCTVSIV